MLSLSNSEYTGVWGLVAPISAIRTQHCGPFFLEYDMKIRQAKKIVNKNAFCICISEDPLFIIQWASKSKQRIERAKRRMNKYGQSNWKVYRWWDKTQNGT